MRKVTLKFDKWRVIRDTEGYLHCYCPCKNSVSRQTRKAIECRCQPPKDVEAALDTMGFFTQKLLGNLLKNMYAVNFIVNMQQLSAELLNKLEVSDEDRLQEKSRTTKQ